MLDELSRNYCTLGRCKKIYTVLCFLYVIFFLFVIGDILTIIIFSAILAAEYLGIYRHMDMPVIIGPLAWILAGLVTGELALGGIMIGLNILMIIVNLGTIPLAIYANHKYHWLEEQPGFPYFNERFEEQKIDKIQHDIKPEYVTNYENMRKNETDQMKDLDMPVPDVKNESNTPSGGYMDSI